METHAYLADWSNGELTIWSPTQGVYGVRTVVADLLEIPYSKVRVIKAPMGGSFGGKQEFLYEPHAAYAAMRMGRPVKLHLTRTQSLISTTVRPALKTSGRDQFHKRRRFRLVQRRKPCEFRRVHGHSEEFRRNDKIQADEELQVPIL